MSFTIRLIHMLWKRAGFSYYNIVDSSLNPVYEAWESTQSEKCLLCKHEGQSLVPAPTLGDSGQVYNYNSRILGAPCASLANQ